MGTICFFWVRFTWRHWTHDSDAILLFFIFYNSRIKWGWIKFEFLSRIHSFSYHTQFCKPFYSLQSPFSLFGERKLTYYRYLANLSSNEGSKSKFNLLYFIFPPGIKFWKRYSLPPSLPLIYTSDLTTLSIWWSARTSDPSYFGIS